MALPKDKMCVTYVGRIHRLPRTHTLLPGCADSGQTCTWPSFTMEAFSASTHPTITIDSGYMLVSQQPQAYLPVGSTGVSMAHHHERYGRNMGGIEPSHLAMCCLQGIGSVTDLGIRHAWSMLRAARAISTSCGRPTQTPGASPLMFRKSDPSDQSQSRQ